MHHSTLAQQSSWNLDLDWLVIKASARPLGVGKCLNGSLSWFLWDNRRAVPAQAPDTMQLLLEFMYGALTASLSFPQAIALFHASHQFEVSDLHLQCVRVLQTMVSIETWPLLVDLAARFSCFALDLVGPMTAASMCMQPSANCLSSEFCLSLKALLDGGRETQTWRSLFTSCASCLHAMDLCTLVPSRTCSPQLHSLYSEVVIGSRMLSCRWQNMLQRSHAGEARLA